MLEEPQVIAFSLQRAEKNLDRQWTLWGMSLWIEGLDTVWLDKFEQRNQSIALMEDNSPVHKAIDEFSAIQLSFFCLQERYQLLNP